LNAETRRRISTHALQHGGGVREEQIDMNQKALESLNNCRIALEPTFKPYLNVSTIAVPIPGRLFTWISKQIEKLK
jgi:hypothetical protein